MPGIERSYSCVSYRKPHNHCRKNYDAENCKVPVIEDEEYIVYLVDVVYIGFKS